MRWHYLITPKNTIADPTINHLTDFHEIYTIWPQISRYLTIIPICEPLPTLLPESWKHVFVYCSFKIVIHWDRDQGWTLTKHTSISILLEYSFFLMIIYDILLHYI